MDSLSTTLLPRQKYNKYFYIFCLCGLALGIVALIGWFIYAIIPRCPANYTDKASGTCPLNPVDHTWYLSWPRLFPRAGCSSETGSCCSWNNATCLTPQGCHDKYEYYQPLLMPARDKNKCNQLWGLLSCAIASPYSGLYVGTNMTITVCHSYCFNLWHACTNSSWWPDADAFCNIQPKLRIAKGNESCYSAAARVNIPMMHMYMYMCIIFILY
jgi:hypothetical protein